MRVESDEVDMFRAGILDSMGLVQFILALEEHFKLRLPLEEIDTDLKKAEDEIMRLLREVTQ